MLSDILEPHICIVSRRARLAGDRPRDSNHIATHMGAAMWNPTRTRPRGYWHHVHDRGKEAVGRRIVGLQAIRSLG